jgi:hypothetical protein
MTYKINPRAVYWAATVAVCTGTFIQSGESLGASLLVLGGCLALLALIEFVAASECED